jgi:GrpB-like predicted nucleotidyltransferase (UPF0157 family)
VITVAEYDPSWPESFGQIRDRVWSHIRDIALTIEHVGSTAVPGLAAKPIIELDVVIPRTARVMGVIGRLAGIGYEHRGDLGIPDREAFKSPADLPAHQLYVCRWGSVALRNHLTFRDHLRQFPSDAATYAALKRTLSTECTNGDEYTRKKTEFIISILAKYSFSAEELDGIRRVNA